MEKIMKRFGLLQEIACKTLQAAAIASLFFFPVLAKANPAASGQENEDKWGFEVGAGGTLSTSEYKGIDNIGSAMPLLGYEGKWLYLRGLNGGVHVFKNENHEINVQLSYLAQQFYASWSDDDQMKKLDDRYSSIMAGLNYRFSSSLGTAQLSISTDILGVNNGIVADASYAFPLTLGIFTFTPAAGVQWTDQNYNQYYYRIGKSESRGSGLSEYDPESAFSPYASLTTRIALTENWTALISGKALFLGSEISDSPMVENSTKFSISAGFMYSF